MMLILTESFCRSLPLFAPQAVLVASVVVQEGVRDPYDDPQYDLGAYLYAVPG